MAVFAYGFRPFFLLAGAYAAVVVPLSLAVHYGALGWPLTWPLGLWHSHELLLGYAVAVVAGFLLTAVPGWQKTPPVAGPRLGLLVAVWVAGRAAMWSAALIPAWLVTVVDLAFVPVLLVVGVPSLWTTRARRNRVFLVILVLLAASNGLAHAAAAGMVDPQVPTALTLDSFVLLIAVLGGRIVPAFTTNALAAAGLREAVHCTPFLERLSLASAAAFLAVDVGATVAPALLPFAGAVALVAAVANAGRLAGWGTRHTLDKPIVWVLHLAYGWLVVGLAAKGLAAVGLFDPVSATHALAVGAIGTMTLAVMSRAGLGHTGRPVVAPRAVALAYGFVSVAAVARMAAATLSLGAPALTAAAMAWTAAFGIFTLVFFPILTRPRPDGRPG